MKALAASSVIQVTTGIGLTPATWRQIGNPSDLYTMAYTLRLPPRRFRIYPMFPPRNKAMF